MKTTNSTFRNTSKILLVLMVMAFTTGNLIAQMDFVKHSDHYSEMLVYISPKTVIIKTLPLFVDFNLIEDIVIEDWMKNPSEWIEKSVISLEMLSAEFIEEQVEIEDWMTEPNWIAPLDEDIQIEEWMTTPATWITAK